jgi:hypothetical protein
MDRNSIWKLRREQIHNTSAGPGTYEVTLGVTDSAVRKDTDRVTVIVK